MTVRLARRYGFSASHRLHSPALSDEENRALYGKCNNPHGHGHNYEVEVTVRGQVDEITGRAIDIAALDRLAEEQILAPFRWRNLNAEERFGSAGPRLERVSIWETERNICQVSDYA